ncbi:rCG24541 [Rattus norvegicus]|uniref:RCG24541 n=1 Tax=Rattus norvegicus TaxID=10116 RepID=A6JBV4_RAT|nr:rCG24541 [Rattus norvegicus]
MNPLTNMSNIEIPGNYTESCSPDLSMMAMKLRLHENLTQTETQPEFFPAVFDETSSRGCQAISQKAPS